MVTAFEFNMERLVQAASMVHGVHGDFGHLKLLYHDGDLKLPTKGNGKSGRSSDGSRYIQYIQ